MRSIRWSCLAAVIAACSSSTSSNGDIGRPGSTGAVPGPVGAGTAAVSGSTGTGGTKAPGFGNPTSTPAMSTGPRVLNDGGVPVADGSACVVGKFCAPTGADQGCGMLTLASTVKTVMKPGNVLIVWDRSTSMDEQWNNMVKWQAAGTALLGALMPLADQLTIGAILFPSPDATAQGLDCTVNPVTSPDQVNFMPGPAAIKALMAAGPNNCPMPLYSSVTACNIGATPTTEAVQQANNTLINATLNGTTVAIIVTDGEPNCNWDQNMTTTTIGNWLMQWGIKTYVVGLPGSGMGNGPAVLNALAQAGGTMQYITPTDSMVLQQKLKEIVSQVVSAGFDSCSIDLMPPTSSPDKLQLVVEETSMPGMQEDVPHDLGSSGGWTITPDGTHVELVGGLCNSAKTGRFAKLTFEFGCKDIPPIPPSHVQ
jgi:hypothetical protein